MQDPTYEPIPSASSSSRKQPSKKTPNEVVQLVGYFLRLQGYDGETTVLAGQHLKPAKSLIEVSGGLENAKTALDRMKKLAETEWGGKSWTISTALKHFHSLTTKIEKLDPEMYG
jgi:hypothetical protein